MKTPYDFKRDLSRTAFGLALVLLPFGANAFNFSLDASRVVSDPAYLPLAGQLFGSSEYSNGLTNLNTNNAAGTRTSSTNTISNAVSQVFDFGLTDDFTLRVADAYQWSTATSTLTDGAILTANSTGFIDPSFGAVWRVLDQKQHAFNWDLMGSYSPNFINAQSADPTQDGTVARGGDAASFGTALSLKTKSFTVYLDGAATYLNDRSILNPNNNITTDYNSSWQYVFSVLTQTRFRKEWSVNLGLTEIVVNDVNGSFVNNIGNVISVNSQPGNVMDFNAALNLQLAPHRFVMSIIYNHDF